MMKNKYDVIIIGGGPAGSTLGCYLAKENIDCVIFEKEKFPRPHVGESLVPACNQIFSDIGVLNKLKEANFPKKYGAIWTTINNKNFNHDWEGIPEEYQMKVLFKEREQETTNLNYTYHVDRAKFDKILLDNAKENGCNIYELHKVIDVKITNDNVTIKTKDFQNNTRNVTAKILVDASGRNTFIGSKKKWKIKDPVFNQFAVHSWFKNYNRNSSENDNITVHFLPLANSWIWQIPITDEITSIGVVAQKEHFINKNEGYEPYFWKMLDSRPDIKTKLQKAERINEFKAEGDYSYAMKQFTANRLLLIGDAARFVDPIFSSGVSIAMNSAKFASKDILKAINKNQFDEKEYRTYNKTITRGSKNWHEFITLYYRLNVMFTYFLSKDKYRIEVLKFLQGDVYDDENPKLLIDMKEFVEAVENNPRHPLHDYLGNLTANAFSNN